MDTTAEKPRYATVGNRRPVKVTANVAGIVGGLIDCQILLGYAEQAMRQASCPENAAPVSVALDAIDVLRGKLRTVAGQLEVAA